MNTEALTILAIFVLGATNILQAIQIDRLKGDVRIVERQRMNVSTELTIFKFNTDLRLKVLDEKIAKNDERSDK